MSLSLLAIIALAVAAVCVRLVFLLKRFTCGSTLEDVIAVAKSYNQKGIRVLINYSPESVARDTDAADICDTYRAVLDRMAVERIQGDLSVKPSSFVGPRRTHKEWDAFRIRLRNLAIHADGRRVWVDEETASDAQFFQSALQPLVFERKNLGLVVRAYRQDALSRARLYANWYVSGARFVVRVCRGAYARDAQLSGEETEQQFLRIYCDLVRHGVPAVAATHSLVHWLYILPGMPEKPAIHMLHGRAEIEEFLEPHVRDGQVSEAAVYLIFGPLRGRIRYGLRRLREQPSLFWGA